jgi:hypothetical protein
VLIGPETEQEKFQHRTIAHPTKEDEIRGSIKQEENRTGENEPQIKSPKHKRTPRSTSNTKENKTKFSIKELQDYNEFTEVTTRPPSLI